MEFFEELLEKIKDFIADPAHLALVIAGAFLVTLTLTCCCLCCLVCCRKSKHKGSKKSFLSSNRRASSAPSSTSSIIPPPPPPPEPRLSLILAEAPSAPTLGQPHPSMLRSLRHAQQLRAERLAGGDQQSMIFYYNDQEALWLADNQQTTVSSNRPRVNWEVPGTFQPADQSSAPPPSYAEANKDRRSSKNEIYPYIPPPTY